MHQFDFALGANAILRATSRGNEVDETQRAVVRRVLNRERTLDGLERLLGSQAVAAVKTLAADDVVVRHGVRLWASPCLSRLDGFGLIAA